MAQAIRAILRQLANVAGDSNEAHRLRRTLRKLGHKGGLRSARG